MTRPFFHRERISDFDLFDLHAENAIAKFKARLREGYAVDFQVCYPTISLCLRFLNLINATQDMVSRFTLDTATAFLFGQDVRSLEAGLPYPNSVSSTPLGGTQPADTHPSSAFANAFQEAQMITALRTRFGEHWPLREFWSDKLAGPMSVVRGFLDPILKEAVAKKRAKGQTSIGDDKKNEEGDREVQEGESLLDHLVNYTDGMSFLFMLYRVADG
jgi:hypothetical protein